MPSSGIWCAIIGCKSTVLEPKAESGKQKAYDIGAKGCICDIGMMVCFINSLGGFAKGANVLSVMFTVYPYSFSDERNNCLNCDFYDLKDFKINAVIHKILKILVLTSNW